ncbi:MULTISPECIES: hypothetical protein [Streptomyces]|uniref:Uncharacterized protein n=1 Tax=Streptomyces tricolor TaxID=68277 RepID=A0ABS9JFL6_9ACTN|nr:hypothetical protein [Streptomyces tricolor]MCE0446703.1 hypothetical protein [Streptomyces tricolor]MCG0064343.1 hypothetical protein [Streptomyces tricolor]
MSKKQDNFGRAARACHRATGVQYNRCWEWAQTGRISRRLPVPDARSPEQRRFEALIAHTLTDPLRDGQLDGAVLGFQGALPDGDRLTLSLHPTMANVVVAALLPRFDAFYGGIRGVPGLRLERRHGAWALVDATSSAVVCLRHADPGWQPSLPGRDRGITRIWADAPTRLSRPEGDELAEWVSDGRTRPRAAARDLLFSRVLRRPLLINTAARSHGWANTYTHHTHDIVIEWCCGVPATDVADALRRSGMTAEREGVDSSPSGHREPHPERIDLGDASIVLRCLRASWCRGETGELGLAAVATEIRRRYE